jgi:Leucine-rich repeat (LRR) protein
MPEETLWRLLLPGSYTERWNTRIEGGRFKALRIDWETLPISSIPLIEGLVVEFLRLHSQATPSGLDFSMFPHLIDLRCDGNQLTELDLSQVPNLTDLDCGENQLTELDLSRVSKLNVLSCGVNQLIELELSQVPSGQ